MIEIGISLRLYRQNQEVRDAAQQHLLLGGGEPARRLREQRLDRIGQRRPGQRGRHRRGFTYGPWTLDDPDPLVTGNVYDDDDTPIPYP